MVFPLLLFLVLFSLVIVLYRHVHMQPTNPAVVGDLAQSCVHGMCWCVGCICGVYAL